MTPFTRLADYPIECLMAAACLTVMLASVSTHVLLAAGWLRSRLGPSLVLALGTLAASGVIQLVVAGLALGLRDALALCSPRDEVFLFALAGPTAVPAAVLFTSSHGAMLGSRRTPRRRAR